MRLATRLPRLMLALLLALSPMHWADARLCDRAPAASHAAAHRADQARGDAGAATTVKAVTPDPSQGCCCGDGVCDAGCSGCVQVLSALSAHPPVFTPLGHTFHDRPLAPVYEFIAHPPTPPPLRA